MTHVEFQAKKEQAQRIGARIAVVVVPTVWCAGIVLLVRLAGLVFGLRVHAPGVAMGVLAALWVVFAVKVAADPPSQSLVERNAQRRKAREADARGYCVIGSNCPVCRGLPTRPAAQDGAA